MEQLLKEDRQFKASASFIRQARIQDRSLFELANTDYCAYWEQEAKQLHWFSPWQTILDWQPPYATWFLNGKLNISYNCLDRHMPRLKNKVAFYWEGEQGDQRVITYGQLFAQVQKCANGLKQLGIKKGDRVALYMPMIPEAIVSMLACARIGAIHTVVFAGFSAQSLTDRIIDAGCKLVVTANGGFRKGNVLPLKDEVDKALQSCDSVEHVLVVNHTEKSCIMHYDRDVWYQDLLAKMPETCPAESMDAEDTLFILYTSGTTGKPKGIVHTTAGYTVGAYTTTKYVFDAKDTDVFWCTADIGWITGHTYVAYGPLLNGLTQVIYEGAPSHPHKGRIWQLIEKYKVSILYTAPTAIRMFCKWGDDIPACYDLSSLRLLGSVGEPLNPEAWMWYYKHIGKQECPIVDTWWQTETGSIMITSLPSIDNMKPGYTGKPLPGIKTVLMDEFQKPVATGSGLLTITQPWPSMMRTLWNDEERFIKTYFKSPDFNLYYTGDAAGQDDDGNLVIIGRVDDVINVSGHRIGTMEVESALVDHEAVAEVAVVPKPHEIKGQAIVAFVILKEDTGANEQLKELLKAHVVNRIGTIARPDEIIFTHDVPKTRSGKIMRRLLRELVQNVPLSDMTTLANQEVIQSLKRHYQKEKY